MTSAPHRAQARKTAAPERIMGVRIHVSESLTVDPHKSRGTTLIVSVLLVTVIAALVLWSRPPQVAQADTVFLFEELPPETTPQARPDPTPPPPQDVPGPPALSPPPQFGLQEEQLSEVGDLAVATGNTLMTEADTIVKAPVEVLPALPQIMDQAPRILKGKSPEYPPRALDRGLEASLSVLITIDTLGRVTQVDVEKSGGRDFDPEVVRSVRQIIFQPPIRNGKRLTARFRQQYEFRLE